jgi:SAM-dependent methyltransferase
MKHIAQIDIDNLKRIRKNVSLFIGDCARKYDAIGRVVLDIAPQNHEGSAPYFKFAHIDTLDIDPESNATFIADICQDNSSIIPNNTYDFIVCTEVLEHTLQPFHAATEIHRLLKPGGLAFVTVPFNLRIHGPLPDCWRITEYGLRSIFNNFKVVEINALEAKDRFLMPIHYTLIAEKYNLNES